MFRNVGVLKNGLAVLVVAIIASVGISSALAEDGLHSNSRSGSYAGNNCSLAHGTLKGSMKRFAREHCRSEHRSGKFNTLRQENYTKLSCVKRKKGTKTITIKVQGTLTYLCS